MGNRASEQRRLWRRGAIAALAGLLSTLVLASAGPAQSAEVPDGVEPNPVAIEIAEVESTDGGEPVSVGSDSPEASAVDGRDTALVENAETDTAEPDASEPVASEPEPVEPVGSEPDAVEPVDPDASEPDAVEPVDPDASEPDAVEITAPEPNAGETPTEELADSSSEPDSLALVDGSDTEARGSLGDFVFEDRNRNGLQDAGEPGVPGINSVLAPGGATTTTDVSGSYLYADLDDGNYTVTFDAAQVASLGLEFTTQNVGDDNLDSDADPVTGDAPGVIADAADITDVDAGVRLIAPSIIECAVGDVLWQNTVDLAAIGDFPGSAVDVRFVPSGGAPVVEVVIPIDTSGLVAGATIDVVTASWDGYWLRAATVPQLNEQWRVLFNSAGSTIYSSAFTPDLADGVVSAGAVANLGTVVLSGDVDEVVLQHWAVDNASTAQNSVAPIAVCLEIDVDGSLGDFTFQDRNENGIQDAADQPLEGVDVTLSGDAADNATTGVDGLYLFSPLPGGDYLVNFSLPAGLTRTLEDVGDDALDSDADGGGDAPVTLPIATDDLTIDAGYVLTPPPVECPAGTVVYSQSVDTSLIGDIPNLADGVQRLIAGSTTEIVVPLNDPVFSDALTVTSLYAVAWDGYWTRVDAVQTNEQFRVHFRDSSDTIIASSEFTDDLADSIYTASFVGQLANADGVSGNSFSLPDGATSLVVEHWSAVNTSESADSLVPIALCVDTITSGLKIEKVTEGGAETFGFTFFPTNDPGDTASFQLTTTGAGAAEAADTGSAFVPIAAGEYTVSEDALEGWDLTGVVCDVEAFVDLPAGAVTFTIPAGTTVSCTFTNEEIVVPTGAIGDFVWDDANTNGIQDAGEPALEGVKVDLLQGGVVIATTTTDANGLYLFDGLSAGEYQVQFEPPAGFVGFTLPDQTIIVAKVDAAADDDFDSDADVTTGLTPIIDLAPGEIDLSIDAGAVRAVVEVLPSPQVTPTPTPTPAPITPLAVTGSNSDSRVLMALALLLSGLGLLLIERRLARRYA